MELSIQERLKDLRVERGLTLEQLAEKTHLSKSALGSYEGDNLKDISHYALIELAKFYEVTVDYLLGRSQTRNHPNADLADLHLSDDMIELLKSGLVDNSLLCELATHPDFPRLMADLEIYVNGIAGKQVQSANAIVDAVDLFEEEMGCSDKVLFIHPKQVTQLRKNPDFLSADKYTPGVSLTGEIGMIAGCRLVPSKKVPLTGGVYACPIVKLEADPEVDDEIPALTIYRKREVNIETERKPKTRPTEITADEFYVAVLSNEAKVVLAKFKA